MVSNIIPKRPRKLFVRCPVWHTPLFEVVDNTLIFKCSSCRGGMHVVSRAKLDQLFDAIAHGADPFTVIDAVIEPQPGEWTVAKEAQG